MGIADILQSFNSKSNQLYSAFTTCLNEIKIQKDVERNLNELAQCILLENTMGFAKCINYYIENDVDRAILSLNIDQEEFFLSIMHVFPEDYLKSNFFKVVWRFKKYFRLAKAYSFKCVALNIFNQELVNLVSEDVIEAKDCIVILSDNEHYLRAFINNSVGANIVKSINGLLAERDEAVIDLLELLVFFEDKTKQNLVSGVKISFDKRRYLEGKKQSFKEPSTKHKNSFVNDENALLNQLGSPAVEQGSVLPFQKTPKLETYDRSYKNSNQHIYKSLNDINNNIDSFEPYQRDLNCQYDSYNYISPDTSTVDFSTNSTPDDLLQSNRELKDIYGQSIDTEFQVNHSDTDKLLKYFFLIFRKIDSKVIKEKVLDTVSEAVEPASFSIKSIENFILDCSKIDALAVARVLDQATALESYLNNNKEKPLTDEKPQILEKYPGYDSFNVTSILLSNITDFSLADAKYFKFFKNDFIISYIKQLNCFTDKIGASSGNNEGSNKAYNTTNSDSSSENSNSIPSLIGRANMPTTIPVIDVEEIKLGSSINKSNHIDFITSKLPESCRISDSNRIDLGNYNANNVEDKQNSRMDSEVISKGLLNPIADVDTNDHSKVSSISLIDESISDSVLNLSRECKFLDNGSACQIKSYKKLKHSNLFNFLLKNSQNATIFFLILLINDSLLLENIEEVISRIPVDERDISCKIVIEKLMREI